MLVQNFHSSRTKATAPYLVNNASKLPSDPKFKIDSVFTAWYTNGQKAEEGHYFNDIEQGEWHYWNENSEPIEEENK